MALRFTVRFSAPNGKRDLEQFHSLVQAIAFAARHGEWIHDEQLRCEFHPAFHGDPDRCRAIIAEVAQTQPVAAKSGGGGRYSASEQTEQRAALLKPGLSSAATSWSGVCPHPTWRDCHLHAWLSLPYIFQARPVLRAGALALRLPFYEEVLRTERARPISRTERFLQRFDRALRFATESSTGIRSSGKAVQACSKCGLMTLAAELTLGGLCRKCGYSRDLAPGIWEDHEGAMHFDIPALLRLFDLPDTPDNRAIATRNIEEVLRRQLPNALVLLRPDQSPAN